MSDIRVQRCLATGGLLVVFTLLLFAGCSPAKPSFPPTPKRPVIDEYHGVKVSDDYRWLEDQDSPEVKAWVVAQNAYSRSILDRIGSRGDVIKRLTMIEGEEKVSYTSVSRHARIFALKSQPPKQHPFLVAVDSPDDLSTERVIVDPGMIDAEGSTAIDFYVPTSDGTLVAVCLSRGGSEDGSVRVFETRTGRDLGDLVPRVNYPTAGGSIAWSADASGFYYTRYPQGDERPVEDRNFYQQVYFHRLGTPSSRDRYVIGREFSRIAEIRLATDPEGRYLLASVANGDGGEFAHFLMNPRGRWTQITRLSDGITAAEFGRDGKLYLLSRMLTPRGKILALSLTNPLLARAVTLVPESGATIVAMRPTARCLYVKDVVGGPSQVRLFTLRGAFQILLPLPPVASVGELVGLDGDDILYRTETYSEPFSYFRYDPEKNSAVRTRLASSVARGEYEVVREFATSKDGTRVPMSILRKKGTALDGKNPVILYGYGGYGIPLSPVYSVRNRFWLEQGGIQVYANLRGGGEFGEEWHRAGKLTLKQNVFDDFIACAQYLIDRKYTSPSRLAIEGGSNGGLLMGAALTQRPDLFRAVVSHVGIYDMLRVELFPNGAFNVTEFGTVKDSAQFKALHAYSPYHRVQEGKAYPAVLMLTGDNDGRVDPANSRKMVARLQAATSSPALLRTSAGSGHGIGTGLSERILQQADVVTFLFEELQLSTKPVEAR